MKFPEPGKKNKKKKKKTSAGAKLTAPTRNTVDTVMNNVIRLALPPFPLGTRLRTNVQRVAVNDRTFLSAPMRTEPLRAQLKETRVEKVHYR